MDVILSRHIVRPSVRFDSLAALISNLENYSNSDIYVQVVGLVSKLHGDNSGCVKPQVDSKTKVAFKYMGLILKGTCVLMSTGGLTQPEWSPCATNPKNVCFKGSITWFFILFAGLTLKFSSF